jgi:O-antigen/teichoic acid export membrane protein
MNASQPALSVRSLRDMCGRYAHINWILADQVVVSAANFLTGIIVARWLGVAGFGVFSLAWLVVLFAQSLQSAFVLAPMQAIGPKQRVEDAPAYYASAFVLQVAFSGIAGVAVLAAMTAGGTFLGFDQTSREITGPIAVVVVATQMTEFFRCRYFATSRPQAAFRIDVVRYTIQVAGILVVFATARASVQQVLLVIPAGAVAGLVTAWRDWPPLRLRGTEIAGTWKRHWNMSKWLAGSALMQWTSGNYFIIVAGVVLGPIAVGALRAAQTLIGVTNVFFQAADNFAPVRAARAYAQHGVTGLHAFMKRLLFIGGAVTLAACIGLALPAKLWLGLVFGSDYRAYASVAYGYSAAYFLMALAMPLRYAFLATEKTGPIFFGYVATTVFALAAGHTLSREWGLNGVVIGIVATQAIMLASFCWHYRAVGRA